MRDVLAEAREAFPAAEAPRDFDVVEIPFPERGEPTLIENGARRAAASRPERRSGPPSAERARRGR